MIVDLTPEMLKTIDELTQEINAIIVEVTE